jgi:hypothetical protein
MTASSLHDFSEFMTVISKLTEADSKASYLSGLETAVADTEVNDDA